MMILMHTSATSDEIALVIASIEARGLSAVNMPGGDHVAIGIASAIAPEMRQGLADSLAVMSGVDHIVHVSRPLKLLKEAGERAGIATVTEVMDSHDVPMVAAHADMLQIGARNMQNFPLLVACGVSGHPVLLKRGPSATLDELLFAAEYILHKGN